MNELIPFNRPFATGRETALMADALARGHLSGDGHYTRRASSLLSEITGVPNVLLTTSCTHALEMAAMLLDIRDGDEVIMPSFTFVSCANAFALRGGRPVFVDIRPDTYNIDESLIEAAITPRTKAILVVHYAGIACEMDAIVAIAQQHGIALIEDNAHGLAGTYRGRQLGSFGQLATLSFHETKNIHCGEGGALLISDPDLVERAEVLREKGTNRSRFFRGQVDKYTWVDVGSSYLPSDLLAAFLTAQLEEFDSIQQQRSAIWRAYADGLTQWASELDVVLPRPPSHVEHPAHLFGLLMPSLDERQRLIAHLHTQQIKAVFHYVPLHSSPRGREFCPGLELPVTDLVSERLVRLPVFAGLRSDELGRIIDAVCGFRP
jgi:dTDP-4-amino-4,6-dideoxygalactose transaminase